MNSVSNCTVYTTRYARAIAEMKIIALVMDWLRYLISL